MNLERLDLDRLDHVFELCVADRLLGHAKLDTSAFRSQAEPEPVAARADRDGREKEQQQHMENDRERVALEASSQICFAAQVGEEG